MLCGVFAATDNGKLSGRERRHAVAPEVAFFAAAAKRGAHHQEELANHPQLNGPRP